MKRIVNKLEQLGWVKRAGVVFAMCAMAAMALPAQTLTTLHSFDGTDGYVPYATLVQATDGELYGTTYAGGPNYGGNIFKITRSGAFTSLYTFCAQSGCADGGGVYAGLVQATDGNFYGTTALNGPNGGGTVFQITPGGTLTTLYGFCAKFECRDGESPRATLIQAANGDLYGTTVEGGAGEGTFFKISQSDALKRLYSFRSGAEPLGGLIEAADGDFYGTTNQGGVYGAGTVYRISPSGALKTLYNFCPGAYPCVDAANPYAGLVLGADGNFYGTTEFGGANGFTYGTIFKITPGGEFTTLYSFCAQRGCADGVNPYAGLVLGTDGNFYGTTNYGGDNTNLDFPNGAGTIFRITPDGALTTLYTFCPQGDCQDGANPYGGLIQATDGNFYGTAYSGGANGEGTVFSLSVGLGPFVETQPASSKIGAAVKILGTDLTGATGVSFNGAAAAFKVVSSSEITTAVPTEASSGKVEVVTPSGTLSSNVPFRVLP